MKISKILLIFFIFLVIINFVKADYCVSGGSGCDAGWTCSYNPIICTTSNNCALYGIGSPTCSSGYCYQGTTPTYYCEPSTSGCTQTGQSCSMPTDCCLGHLCENSICKRKAGETCTSNTQCASGLYCSPLGICDIDLVNKKYFAVQLNPSLGGSSSYNPPLEYTTALIITEEGNAYTPNPFTGNPMCKPQVTYSTPSITPYLNVNNNFYIQRYRSAGGIYGPSVIYYNFLSSIYVNQVNINPETNSYLIKDSTNQIVAAIRSNGNFYIKGRIMDDLCPNMKVYQVPKCGDGIVDSRWEECGEPGINTCSSSEICTNCRCEPRLQTQGPICGNGIVEVEEVCDDGNTLWNQGGCAADCSGINYADLTGILFNGYLYCGDSWGAETYCENYIPMRSSGFMWVAKYINDISAPSGDCVTYNIYGGIPVQQGLTLNYGNYIKLSQIWCKSNS